MSFLNLFILILIIFCNLPLSSFGQGRSERETESFVEFLGKLIEERRRTGFKHQFDEKGVVILQSQNKNSAANPDKESTKQKNRIELKGPEGDGKTKYDKNKETAISSDEVALKDLLKYKKVREYYAAFIVEYLYQRKRKVGKFIIKLFHSEAPLTVKNFVELAEGQKEFTDPKTNKKTKKPFYKDLLFFRVEKNFVMQTGDPTNKGTSAGPGYNLPLEIDKKLKHNKMGVVSMALSNKESHGSQFFITLKETPYLDGKNTIFGEVSSGLNTLKEIQTTPVTPAGSPKSPIIIRSLKILRKY